MRAASATAATRAISARRADSAAAAAATSAFIRAMLGTSNETVFELLEYKCRVSLSERIENVYVESNPPLLANTSWFIVMLVFNAVASPTFPVAIPHPLDVPLLKKIA